MTTAPVPLLVAPPPTPLRQAALDVVPGLLVDCSFYLTVFALGFLVERAGGTSLHVSLVFGVYTLAYAVLAPLMGRASDRLDRRRVLLASSLLFVAIPALLAALLHVEPGAGPGTIEVAARVATPLPLIYAASALFALSNALFWPALQARIGDREPDPAARGRAIRRFNVGWTVGKALGFLISGTVFQLAPAACLPLGALLGGSVFLLLLALDRAEAAPVAASPDPALAIGLAAGPPQATKRAYLLAGLGTNFAVWASLGTLQSLAPKLAESLHLSPAQAGALVCAALSAQGAVFFSLGGSRAWAYRPWSLVLATPACAGGLLLLLAASGFPLALVGALLIGAAQAVTYAASVFYALDYDHRRGLRTGIHEANLALAGAVPILGGWLADHVAWLRAPLAVVLLPCGAVALATALLLPRAGTPPDT